MATQPTQRSTLQMVRRAAEVGGHVVRETIRPPKALSRADVPASRKSVTTEWLTDVLCRDTPGAAVIAFKAEDVSSGTSERWRIKVQYNDAGRAAGLPEIVFAKSTLKFTQRLLFGLFDNIRNEPDFYTVYRPKVEFECPKGYYGAVDNRTWRGLTLIEDIAESKGATFCTPATPITREDMDDLLGNMAAWHGYYWQSDRLDHGGVLKLPSVRLRDLEGFGFRKRALVGIERTPDLTPPELLGKGEMVYGLLERSFALASAPPFTLLHGDCHIGNTYRTVDGRMGFADWQGTLKGSWAYDVAYTMSTGLAIADRRAWERDLLAGYLERLAAAGGEPPPFEEAWRMYCRQLVYPYIVWVWTIGRGPLQPKMQPDEISRGIIERSAQAIVDNDVLELVRTAAL